MQLLFLGDSITDAGHHFTSDGLGNGSCPSSVTAASRPCDHKPGTGRLYGAAHSADAAQDPGSCTPDLATLLVGINDVPLQLFAGQTLDDFASAYESVLKVLASCKTVITGRTFSF